MKPFGFFLIAILISIVLMQIYVARGVDLWLMSLQISSNKRIWIERILLIALLYFNLSIAARIFFRTSIFSQFAWLKTFLIFPGTTWIVTLVMMFFCFAAKDLAVWFYSFFKEDSVDLGRRTFLQAAGAISVGAPLILTGYGALKTSRDYNVKHIEIAFKNLPPGLDGFKIAQISDIHSGIYMNEREMRNIREIMDSQHPQIAVVTGDLVDGASREITPVARVFSKLKTDYGIFCCMGNHDLFDNYGTISAAMNEAGILMLENMNRILHINGEELNLLGVNDSGKSYDLSNLPKTLHGVDPDGFKVLLAHRPEFFPRTFQYKIDLQLSGHTHGGQIGLNFFGSTVAPMQFFHKYIHGLYKEGQSNLYVNPGVGMVFAPIRIGIRPEITLITLRS